MSANNEFIGWAVTHILNLVACSCVITYCTWRYYKQRSRFNLALITEPSLLFVSLSIKLTYFVTGDKLDACGMLNVFTCLDVATQFTFLAQLAHLFLQQWKLHIIKAALLSYNERLNTFLGVVGVVLYILCALGWQSSRSGASVFTIVLFYGYAMIFDISAFILIVMSLRRIVKIRNEVLNVETQAESKRVQAFLALSLATIIISGSLFGAVSIGFWTRDGLSNWLATIQVISSYYYFYNVATVLSGRRSSVMPSKKQTAESTPAQGVVESRRFSASEFSHSYTQREAPMTPTSDTAVPPIHSHP